MVIYQRLSIRECDTDPGDYERSYWTWIILGSLIVLSQLLGVTEKVWIKVCATLLFFVPVRKFPYLYFSFFEGLG